MQKKQIRLGLLQYPITENFESNFKKAISLLNQIKKFKPRTVVLPEMWLGSPAKPELRPGWAKDYGAALRDLGAWCKSNAIGAVFSQLEREKSRYFNTAYFLKAQNGRAAGSYRKIHLFSLGGEKKIFSAGKQFRPFAADGAKIGLAVCYDIRFPELIRRLAALGGQIIFVPAQWPASRMEHWLTLLRARAIENQLFVVGCNRLGHKGALRFNGHSVIFDPWGAELLHLGPRENYGVASIDLGEMARIREQYPFFKEKIL